MRAIPLTACLALAAALGGCASDPGLGDYNRGVALQADGDLVDAIAAYKDALELQPDLIRARFNLAVALEQKGEPERAAAEYETILKQSPEHARSLVNLAGIVGRDDDARATGLFAKAAEVELDAAWPLVYQGLHHQRQGREAEAERVYSAALERDPDSAIAHYRLGSLRESQERWDDAASSYREATGRETGSADTWEALGRAARRAGDRRTAIGAFERALALDPARDALELQLGELYDEMGESEIALGHLRMSGENVAGVKRARLIATLHLLLAQLDEGDPLRGPIEARLKTMTGVE